jgi:hypothetical protein
LREGVTSWFGLEEEGHWFSFVVLFSFWFCSNLIFFVGGLDSTSLPCLFIGGSIKTNKQTQTTREKIKRTQKKGGKFGGVEKRH